ncbi:MAG: acyl carrier protein [Kiritimatiellae bacterium]|jgi:acyl carrier protein|nr:acyl carrier protein [Kiritimatiellia bacterium]
MTLEETEQKVKEIIVSSLDLEDVSPSDIDTEAPLFGEGLGLDSIDALELGMAIKREFGISFSKDPAENKRVFRSVRTLAAHIMEQKQ